MMMTIQVYCRIYFGKDIFALDESVRDLALRAGSGIREVKQKSRNEILEAKALLVAQP